MKAPLKTKLHKLFSKMGIVSPPPIDKEQELINGLQANEQEAIKTVLECIKNNDFENAEFLPSIKQLSNISDHVYGRVLALKVNDGHEVFPTRTQQAMDFHRLVIENTERHSAVAHSAFSNFNGLHKATGKIHFHSLDSFYATEDRKNRDTSEISPTKLAL